MGGIRALALGLLLTQTAMQGQTQPTNVWERTAALDKLAGQAVANARVQFPGLKEDQIAVTVVDLTGTGQARAGAYRGDVQIYPASVIKLFYLAAVHRWAEDGKLEETPELRRAMSDMIVHSYNEATHYLVDVLTGTTSGPELSPAELEEWYYKRCAVTRYFESIGYKQVNANRKPWCEGPYGREMQSVKLHKPNHRNWLTTDATARLMSEIVQGRAVTPGRSKQMLELMARDPFAKTKEPDQANAFTGLALQPGAKLWSKAGWTSETRHDAAYVELPDGRKIVLVTFTVGHANERGIIPAVAKYIFERIGREEAGKTN